MFFLVYLLVFIVGICSIIDIIMKQMPAYKAALKIPGPFMFPIIGNLPMIMLKDGEGLFHAFRNKSRQYNRNWRGWIFGVLHYQVIRAADLEVLLTSTKYITKDDMYRLVEPIIGTGLLTSTGQKWFHRRKIITPAFNFNILQNFLPIINEESQKTIEYIKTLEHKNGTDLQDIVSKFTLNTLCETALGVQLDTINEGDFYRSNVVKLSKWIVFRAVNFWLHLDFFYKVTGLFLIINKYTKNMHKFSSSVISRRRKAYYENKIKGNYNRGSDGSDDDNIYFGKRKRTSMLDTLFDAESNGCQIDELGIKEEVNTFMLAGYDTTSSAVTFILFMLAHHKNWQNLVYKEVLDVLGNRSLHELEISNYNEMKVLNRVIKESMRLYPPIALLGREISEPFTTTDGIELPVGTQVHIHTYDLHRDPEQFPDPEKFDPDRFLPENASKMHPMAYIPFSAGPRNCIAQKFGILEVQSLITNILFSFELSPITAVEDVVFLTDISLRPKYPVKIKFLQRNQ